ncbi:putative addiction module CopG family antidote [Pseudorhizobium tarimense]|uniref:Addiction module CopG family antidote n=1 Tax=Pseudorhizobium tarimense TaxID=1079109 RepID=A0ABV2H6U7_9HYPH|nr:type II toxin-antitoxin system ParD family antitoxin [Pseudorhizobium tarimense]MCJ8519443.1 type II toxin-antitoxin system ParD family antitoxin [Pseudorhizobium tarimense]
MKEKCHERQELQQHVSDFVDREVASGRHRSASEVVTEALRRYEDDISAVWLI